ncbi:MAG: hypothetical protein Q9170_003664 [Blastenia crenularia]
MVLLLLFSTSIAAQGQGLPPLTSNANEQSTAKTTAAAKSASKPTATAQSKTAKAQVSDAAPTDLPALKSSNDVPSGLPTRKGQKAPTPTVPPTANAPYMRKSNLPEGTVFICVGAALAFIGLVVLAWRGLVAWSLHRSVRKAAMAQSTQYTQLGDAKSKSKTPGTPFYSQGPGSTLSLDRLAASSKGGSKTHTARSGLFFSPTAGAGMQNPNRGSGYLPAGYYAAGNSAPGGGSGMTHLGGGSPMTGAGAHNHRHSRARSAGPSPPGTPSLPPSRGAEVAYGRPSTAGLSTQASASTLNLSTAPEGRAPSAYLEDLFEEIMSLILDYVTVSDLIRFARVSKRMKEMVYDDSRWVQRLRYMDCWNEAEARRRAEAAWRRRAGPQSLSYEEHAERAGIGVDECPNTAAGNNGKGPSGKATSETGWEQVNLSTNGQRSTVPGPKGGTSDGFDAVPLSPESATNLRPQYKPQDPLTKLNIFSQVRSIRGQARQEYGQIYGALNPYYIDATACKDHTTAIVFRIYRDPNHQAQMLANLLTFGRSDITQGWQERQDKLQILVEAFESAVAHEFEQALQTADIDGRLRKYGHVLTTLNGGKKGVEIFISNCPTIARKNELGDPMDCLRLGPPGNISLDETQRFFNRLSTSFNEQIAILDRVFPASVNAAATFLQRVSKEVFSEYLSTLFDEAHRTGAESYLKAVSGTYQQSLYMARALRPSKDAGDDFDEAIDRVVASAFELHVDLYLNEEYSHFKRKSEAEVSEWERQLSEQDASMQSLYMSNVNRQADKRDFLTSFKKVVMMPVNVLPTFPLSSPFGGKSATARALVNGENVDISSQASSQLHTRPSTPSMINGTSSMNKSMSSLPEPPTTELAAKAAIMSSRLEGIRSLFSIEVALNLVHTAKSAIERAAIFYRAQSQFGEDSRRQCQSIFVLLLQILGGRHIKAGFDQAVDHLTNYDPKEIQNHGHGEVKPLVTFLELVNVGDLIQQMVDVFYEQEMVATRLTDRNDFLDPAVKEKKRFEQMLDERVAAGMSKGIEVLMSEVDFICATTQKADDFNPDASGAASSGIMDIGPTETARKVVDVISSHTKMLVGSTDKNMLDVFNQEVGLRVFTALCKLLKRHRISVTGSIKLISDMNHYFSYVQTLKNQNLLQYFTALRELAQIYLVDPSDAKELASIIADGDRFHGIFRAEEVYEFAERRADWYQIRPKVERAMYGYGCLIM